MQKSNITIIFAIYGRLNKAMNYQLAELKREKLVSNYSRYWRWVYKSFHYKIHCDYSFDLIAYLLSLSSIGTMSKSLGLNWKYLFTMVSNCAVLSVSKSIITLSSIQLLNSICAVYGEFENMCLLNSLIDYKMINLPSH